MVYEVALPFSTSTFNAAGIDIEVAQAGQGRPLLFLHAGPSPLWPDHACLDALATRFRVIAPWHPGFGASELPTDFRDVCDIAYTYLDLIERLGLDDVVLAGASFGGWIAAEMAVRSTNRLGALVLAGAFGIKVSDRETRDIADFYAMPMTDWPALAYADPVRWAPDYGALPQDELERIARARESMAYFGWKPFMHNPQLRRWLHRIDVPSLVLWGSEDRVAAPRYGRAYAQAIGGNAEFVLVEGAGHYPHIERAADVAALVGRFAAPASSSSKALSGAV
jgi:pimeloyl-ACP methyl ester carboxylesterase